MHTPGHTPGHVSLWREEDALLLAGDAFATTDLDAWSTQADRELSALAQTDFVPAQGRYVTHPVIADATGVQDVPPPVKDPLPKRLLAGALAAGAL